jgi:hypothetical protein
MSETSKPRLSKTSKKLLSKIIKALEPIIIADLEGYPDHLYYLDKFSTSEDFRTSIVISPSYRGNGPEMIDVDVKNPIGNFSINFTISIKDGDISHKLRSGSVMGISRYLIDPFRNVEGLEKKTQEELFINSAILLECLKRGSVIPENPLEKMLVGVTSF